MSSQPMPMPMPRPAMDAPRSNHKMVTYLYAVAIKLAASPYYLTTNPTAAVIYSMGDVLAAANRAARGGDPSAVAERDKIRKDAEFLLGSLVLFVWSDVRKRTEDAAFAADIILSTGLSLRRHIVREKAPLTVRQARRTRIVTLSAKAPGRKAAYVFEASLDGCTWTIVSQSLVSRVTVTGLTAGQTYAFRVRAQTVKGGLSDYSPVVTFLVR
jgi:hypothetical protein